MQGDCSRLFLGQVQVGFLRGQGDDQDLGETRRRIDLSGGIFSFLDIFFSFFFFIVQKFDVQRSMGRYSPGYLSIAQTGVVL